jgi:hypothetical protein
MSSIVLDNIAITDGEHPSFEFCTFLSHDVCIVTMRMAGINANAHITRSHARTLATRMLECLDRADAMDAEAVA